MNFSHWKCISIALIMGILVATVGCTSSDDAQVDSETTENSEKKSTTDSSAKGESSALSTKPLPDPFHPVVVIKTSEGDITVELDAERANLTVMNFLEYVQENHYDDTIFHDVVKGYIMQGGSLTEKLEKKPLQDPNRKPVTNEATNGLKNTYGTIAMARQDESKDSATCQFFINLDDNTHLDWAGDSDSEFGYCVFGNVIQGIDVVKKIADTPVKPTETSETTPVKTVRIITVQKIR